MLSLAMGTAGGKRSLECCYLSVSNSQSCFLNFRRGFTQVQTQYLKWLINNFAVHHDPLGFLRSVEDTQCLTFTNDISISPYPAAILDVQGPCRTNFHAPEIATMQIVRTSGLHPDTVVPQVWDITFTSPFGASSTANSSMTSGTPPDSMD
jgi:hypothetical protein